MIGYGALVGLALGVVYVLLPFPWSKSTGDIHNTDTPLSLKFLYAGGRVGFAITLASIIPLDCFSINPDLYDACALPVVWGGISLLLCLIWVFGEQIRVLLNNGGYPVAYLSFTAYIYLLISQLGHYFTSSLGGGFWLANAAAISGVALAGAIVGGIIGMILWTVWTAIHRFVQ